MYVCICRQVTDKEIKSAIKNGCNTLDALSAELEVGTQCGSCCCHAEELLEELSCKSPAECSNSCHHCPSAQ